MSNNQYSFTPKQKRILHLSAGLLWVIGIAILYRFSGLSFLSFIILDSLPVKCC